MTREPHKLVLAIFIIILVNHVTWSVEMVLPPYVQRIQTPEQLMSIGSFMVFSTKLYKNYYRIQAENKVAWGKKTVTEKAELSWAKTLEYFKITKDRESIENFYRITFEHSHEERIRQVSFKMFRICGIVKEETIETIERVSVSKTISDDLFCFIFESHILILGTRPIRFPASVNLKFFNLLYNKIGKKEYNDLGYKVMLFKTGKKIISELWPQPEAVKTLDQLASFYEDSEAVGSLEDHTILNTQFSKIARVKELKQKVDLPIVNALLKGSERLKSKSSDRDKSMMLNGLFFIALADGLSPPSVKVIKREIFIRKDMVIKARLIKSLFAIADEKVFSEAYSMLLSGSLSASAKSNIIQYFEGRNDKRSVSLLVDVLKRTHENSFSPKVLSAKEKEMHKKLQEKISKFRKVDKSPEWFKTSTSTLVRTIKSIANADFKIVKSFPDTKRNILEWWKKNSSNKKFFSELKPSEDK